MEKRLPSEQKIFDKVAVHLITQNKQALSSYEYGGVCRYKSENGLKCAIGCLIPDKVYVPGMEGTGVSKLASRYKQLLLEYIGENIPFLDELQCIHDKWEPSYWYNKLTLLAIKYNLNTRAMVKLGWVNT